MKATAVPEVTTSGLSDPASTVSERLDSAPVCLTVIHVLREVVIEGEVNHAIRHGCTTAQAFEVFKIAAMHLRASLDQRLGARIRARKSDHLVAGADAASGTSAGPINAGSTS